METPMGQAATTRVIAAVAILVLPGRMIASRASAALVMMASFAFEGHTASSETRTTLGTGALLIHVMAVHWWLGALYPLLILVRNLEPVRLGPVVEAFGRQAIWIVAALLAGGIIVLTILTGAKLNLASPYQQRFLLKLALVAVLLSLAAWNKLRLTSLLRRDPANGRAKLHRSIKAEILVGLFILITTAWALNSSPEG
jgi:putative copper export protein